MSFTYRGLKGQLERHIVTGEEIDRQIQRLQQQNPRVASVQDRATQLGDEVVLDYAGFCNGEQFAGGTAQGQTLVLGSGMFIPGFEEQLVDKVPEEIVTVKVTFPEQYHSADLAGKEAEFQCVIHAIRVKTAYELDDTFAKEVGGCDTFEEMRVRVGEAIQAYADEQGEMELQDKLLRQAAESLEMEVSPEAVEAELDEQMKSMEAQLSQQGLSLEMYCGFMGTTPEKLREENTAAAENAVRQQAAVNKIVELEGLTATAEELEEATAVVARQNRMTVEQLKPYMDEQFEAALKRSIMISKVMRLIRDNADITTVTDGE